jgi:hypothetical protein
MMKDADVQIYAGAEAGKHIINIRFSCLLSNYIPLLFPSLIISWPVSHMVPCKQKPRPSKTASPPSQVKYMHRRRHVQYVPSHTRPTYSHYHVAFTRPPSTPHGRPRPPPSTAAITGRHSSGRLIEKLAIYRDNPGLAGDVDATEQRDRQRRRTALRVLLKLLLLSENQADSEEYLLQCLMVQAKPDCLSCHLP